MTVLSGVSALQFDRFEYAAVSSIATLGTLLPVLGKVDCNCDVCMHVERGCDAALAGNPALQFG